MLTRFSILLALVTILALPFIYHRQTEKGTVRADDTVVIVTPHNEALRVEFGWGFCDWYKARTGRTVNVDWRVVGGTSEISRFLETQYDAAFQLHWTRTLGRAWSA